MAARCRGHIVVVNFNKILDRTDVLVHVQHHQAVRSDEGCHLELHSHLDLFDGGTRADAAADAPVPIVIKAGDIRHG